MYKFSTQHLNPSPRSGQKSQANVLGVGISAVDMNAALDACDELLASTDRGYICVTGVHGVMEAQRDPSFRDILNRSFVAIPDGMPVVWAGRLQGHGAMRRVYGPDFMIELCRRCVKRGYSHFFYGGKPEVAPRLAEELRRRLPGLRVTGTYSPPFRPLNSEEERDLEARIRALRPDIIWVGLSTPKQERFMADHIARLDTRLMVGVGAAFDVHTGGIRDAPDWVKAAGLQWLHRLEQEPRRLWRRYLRNNPAFLCSIAFQLSGIRRYTIPS